MNDMLKNRSHQELWTMRGQAWVLKHLQLSFDEYKVNATCVKGAVLV